MPDEHLVDTGYVDAEQIHHARRDHGIDLVGPIGKITNREQVTGGFFDNTHFAVDWDQRQAVCPGGHTSVQWRDAQSHRGTPVTRVRFAERHCGPCELRTSCTNAKSGRNLTLRPRAEHDILQQARVEQDTDHWRRRYGHRADVEGTISQGVQAFGLRRSATAGSPGPGATPPPPDRESNTEILGSGFAPRCAARRGGPQVARHWHATGSHKQ